MIKRENGIEYEVINAEHTSKINLLFVHGTGCNKKFLRALATVLKEYNCYLMDLPGHGGSDNTGYSIENYVKAISYMADKIGNVILVGHSLGGTLVAKTASLNLKSVRGAIILNSGASYPKLKKDFLEKAHNGILDVEYFMDTFGHRDNKDVQASIKSMEPAGIAIADLFMDEVVNIEDSMKDIKVPTLIFGGDDEILVIPEYVERLHKLIKDSELIMMPGGRHMVCIAEKHKTRDFIYDFINRKIINKNANGIEYEVIKAEHKSNLNLLFVHGTGCNRKFLTALVAMFKEYNCYVMDLPGHGDSISTGYNFDNYVNAVKFLANKLNNVVLIGHSLGGTIVAKVASLNLKTVKGAIILNSGASYPKLNRKLLKDAHNGKLDSDYLLEASGHLDNKEVQEAIKTMEPAGVCIVDLFIDENVNIEKSMKDVKVPVLIIGGADEILAIPEYVEKFHNLIKTSKLIMIPYGRHMVCIAEKHKVKELISDFLKKDVIKKRKLELESV